MPPGTRHHERATNRRGRTTGVVVPLAAFAAGASAMPLGHEENLGLMILALLTVAGEAAARAMRSPRDGEPPSTRR